MNVFNPPIAPTIFYNPPGPYGNTSGLYGNTSGTYSNGIGPISWKEKLINLNNPTFYTSELMRAYKKEVDKRFTCKIVYQEEYSETGNGHPIVLWINNTDYSVTLQIKLTNGYIFDFSINRDVFAREMISPAILIEYIVCQVKKYSVNNSDIEYLTNELNRLFNNQDLYKSLENRKSTISSTPTLPKPKKSQIGTRGSKSSNKQLEFNF